MTAKKHGKGKGKKKGPTNAQKSAKVNKLVGTIIGPELRGLNSQRSQVARDYAAGVDRANTAYERGKGDIEHVFGETGAYLDMLKGRNDAEAAAGASRSDAAAAALRARLGNTYSGVQSGVESELARLGISGGGNLSGLMADAANAQYTADQASANARSTLDQSNSNAGLVMSLLQGMNQGSKMSAAGKNLNARNDAIADFNTARISQLNKIGDAIQETRKSRSDLFTQLFNQFQQSGWKGFLKG